VPYGSLKVVTDPMAHQVKEFNIIPASEIEISKSASISSSSFISVDLIVPKTLKRNTDGGDDKERDRAIHLTSINANLKGEDNVIKFANIKTYQRIIPGKTKGHLFKLRFTLRNYDIQGREISHESVHSLPFYIWSNVNQPGFPKSSRMIKLRKQAECNKKKRDEKKRKNPPPKAKKNPPRSSKKRKVQST